MTGKTETLRVGIYNEDSTGLSHELGYDLDPETFNTGADWVERLRGWVADYEQIKNSKPNWLTMVRRQDHSLLERFRDWATDPEGSGSVPPKERETAKDVVQELESRGLALASELFASVGTRYNVVYWSEVYWKDLQTWNRKEDSSSVDRQEAILAALSACPLYLIIDESLFDIYDPLALAREAVDAGVRMVQLRIKTWDKTWDKWKFAELVEKLRRIISVPDSLLIVNDDPVMAYPLADGVHLGESDMDLNLAREDYSDLIIGATARTPEAAWEAEMAEADYIGCGSVFASSTKGGLPVIGLDGLAAVNRYVSIPVVAVGGITPENCGDVLDTGVAGFCVIAPFRHGEPADVVRQFMDACAGHGWRAQSNAG